MGTALYARKSQEAEDRQVQSIEDQKTALSRLAEASGFRIDYEYQEARSAKEPHTRPVFDQLISDIKSGKVDALVCWNMNRLSRNPVDGGQLSHLLMTEQLRFIRTPERTYKPEDSALLLAIENGMATAFIQDLRRSVKRGLQGKIDRGWFPGKAPLGYLNNSVTREIDPDPELFPQIRKAWELLAAGYTAAEVLRELPKMNFQRKCARRRAFGRSQFYKIFQNPFYKGQILFKGQTYPGKHVPMVSEQEFACAQKSLSRSTSEQARKREFVYNGIIKCGSCGCAIVGEERQKTYKSTGRVATYRYYHCSGAKGCSKKAVHEEWLDQCFYDCFEQLRIPLSFVDWCKDALHSCVTSDKGAADSSITRLAETRMTEQKRLDRLLEMRLEDEISATEYSQTKAESERRIAEITQRIDSFDSEDEWLTAYIYGKLDVAASVQSVGAGEYKAHKPMIQSMIQSCTLNLEALEIWFDPIIHKIATFEPLRNSSETPIIDDPNPTNPIWYRLVDDIRNLALEVIRAEVKRRSELAGTSKALGPLTVAEVVKLRGVGLGGARVTYPTPRSLENARSQGLAYPAFLPPAVSL